MKVKFYGRLGERLGSEIELRPPSGVKTVDQLRVILAKMYPDSSEDILKRSRACVGDSIVEESHKLEDGEIVEFFPPLSGG